MVRRYNRLLVAFYVLTDDTADLAIALMLMVLVTTFIAPPLLKRLLGPASGPGTTGDDADRPGSLVHEA